jgi:hypothetical protein
MAPQAHPPESFRDMVIPSAFECTLGGALVADTAAMDQVCAPSSLCLINYNTNEASPQTNEVYPYPKSCGFRLM